MENFRWRWSPADLDAGATWLAVGFFFKCGLADNFAQVFHRADTANAWQVWLSTLVFGLRIYFDFAGYSLIALGVARCIGVRLTMNFQSPYCSASVTEFWRRWHVTLSQWFRDYLYIPLGGNRRRAAFNLFIVFLVSGAWHGAGWNFLVWGALHGAALLVARALGPRIRLPRAVAWGLTMLVVFAAWIAFYETDDKRLWSALGAVVNPAAYSLDALRAAFAPWKEVERLILACFLALAGASFALEAWALRKNGEPYALHRSLPVAALLVVLTLWIAPGEQNGFIYFAF